MVYSKQIKRNAEINNIDNVKAYQADLSKLAEKSKPQWLKPIDKLLLEGAKVNKGNNHKNTALHLAAQNGWTEIAEKLLRHRKINIDGADLGGNTALHLAAQNGQIGVGDR